MNPIMKRKNKRLRPKALKKESVPKPRRLITNKKPLSKTSMKTSLVNKTITSEDKRTPKTPRLKREFPPNPTLWIERAEQEEEKKFPNKEQEDIITEHIKMTLKRKKLLNKKPKKKLLLKL